MPKKIEPPQEPKAVQPTPTPQPSLTPQQYRTQMNGFQIGAFGGGADESMKRDAFYQAGYRDGAGMRKGYAAALKKLIATPPVHAVNEPVSNNRSGSEPEQTEPSGASAS